MAPSGLSVAQLGSTQLTQPRMKVLAGLTEQIDEGEKVRDDVTFDETRAATWHEHNRALLRQAFSTSAVVDNYDRPITKADLEAFPSRKWGKGAALPSEVESRRLDRARSGGDDYRTHCWRLLRLEQVRDLLHLYPDPAKEPERPGQAVIQAGTEVFLVHGHDHATKNVVARVLQQLTGRDPVILHEQPSEGRTIIEKFENYAGTVAAAVVILTPDDKGGSVEADDDYLNHRARQNVVYELGWFHGRLGRGRVIALVVGKVEHPSDVSGVLYIPMDAVGGWKMELARELRNTGIAADANNLKL